MYRTKQVRIKQGHKLHHYCADLCEGSTALYNRANYIVRQYATGRKAVREKRPLHDNQKEILQLAEEWLSGTDHMPKGDWFSYGKLDYLLKVTKDHAYYGIPSHVNQQLLKQLFSDYKSFFAAVRGYAQCPSAYTGRPKLPHYKKGSSTAFLSNEVCVIKDGHYLKLPKTKTRLNLGPVSGTLKSVRVIKQGSDYVAEAVFELPDTGISEEENILPDSAEMVMAIDPGVNNLCAVTGTADFQPFLINGRILKSVNQWYNKELARLKSAAMKCNDVKTSRRIRALTKKRNRRIRDIMHKISRYLTEFAKAHDIKAVIFGHNDQWKTECKMGKETQGFVQLPFDMLCSMIQYKLNEAGIPFLKAEESYTSRADYMALDDIPVYGTEKSTRHFSGVRVKRGLYRHYDGSLSNADINGAANLLRKVFPNAPQEIWDRGLMDSPCRITIA